MKKCNLHIVFDKRDRTYARGEKIISVRDNGVGLAPEVKDRLDLLGTRLSGGQQQRLTLARALSHRPEILCLDEFSIAIDPVTTMKIEDILREMKSRMTIVLATNLVQQARRLADRLGAGVAGLQAIATAKRLGAVVEAYDVRSAAGEHVRSLGARFLQVDLGGIQTEDKGGYAVELSEEAMNRGRELITQHARTSDVIITSAQVPGRRAPLLLTEEAVAGMKPDSIIVDLAASTGGNCALTDPGETVVLNGVSIMAPLNLAATVPVHASQLYSRNVTAFLKLLINDKGELNIDLSDDVVWPTCVVHDGEVVNQRVAAALEAHTR